MALFRLYKKQWESGFRSFHTLGLPQSKHQVDDDPAGKAGVLSQSSPSTRPSLIGSKKRRHSESSRFDDNGVDEVGESSPSSRQRTLSPSPSSISRTPTVHISMLPNRHESRSRAQPPARRKGISSGVSIVTRRASGVKEVWRKGRDGGEKGSIVGSRSKGGKKTSTVEDKWWTSLGGGKKGSIRL